MGIEENVANELWTGMTNKELNEEAKVESEGLDQYLPTFEEFCEYIKTLNPRSAGGPSGLTYVLVQYWPENVKKRVYNALKEAWEKRKIIPGWGRRFLKPIPKICEPGLEDLRPFMLIEVTRKIWVGLIMKKIADFWDRWGLIDDAQHAYIRGKGTGTALSQLINGMETARDFGTDIYISSWDMTRAFDSVGKKFLRRCLVRLGVPAGLAAFIISLDDEGHVFVKCPYNVEVANGGINELEEIGYKFMTKKGTGQGDMPSPLLWVATLDTLLTSMAKLGSEFKVQDIVGQTYNCKEVASADNLQSMEATLRGL